MQGIYSVVRAMLTAYSNDSVGNGRAGTMGKDEGEGGMRGEGIILSQREGGM